MKNKEMLSLAINKIYDIVTQITLTIGFNVIWVTIIII